MTENGFLAIVNEYCKKTGISTKNIVRLFAGLGEPVASTKLTENSYISKNALALFKKEFATLLMPTFNKLVLNDHHKNIASLARKLIADSEMTDVTKIGLSDEILDLIMASRLDPERSYDQFSCTRETLQKRVQTFINQFDLHGKKILLIGDDDFLSIALAVTKLADQITVLEIDKRIFQTITKINKSIKLNIDIRLFDVKNKLDNNLLNSFDVVFTDPPYTPSGIALFVSRSIQSLNFHNKSARIYFCYGNSEMGKERFLEIQEQINKMGLYLSGVKEKFNQYTGAESIGNTSNLYVCEMTARTKPVISTAYNGKLYTNN